MRAAKNAGRARDLVLTRVPHESLIWVGIVDGGAVRITPAEARALLAQLERVIDEAERVQESDARRLAAELDPEGP